ncbi:cytospin-A-like isoform X6 [Hermetia illucens]|uniref:cytospin-A-like isoform X6 n=1 Tax=Hermetia illucens TaxID=343691 RepID=UPI0018CC59D9|nr:cytospin-A-like isoform X6 [Hermetia illucens]
MFNISDKIRKIFARQTDTYSFGEEEVSENADGAASDTHPESEERTQATGRNVSVPGKANTKRLNDVSIARKSSLTSAQLNSEVSLLRQRRIPSISSVSPESPPSNPPIAGSTPVTSTPKHNTPFRRFLTRQKPIETGSIRVKSNKKITAPKEAPPPPPASPPPGRRDEDTKSLSGKSRNNRGGIFSSKILKKPKSFPDLHSAAKKVSQSSSAAAPSKPVITAPIPLNNNSPKVANKNNTDAVSAPLVNSIPNSITGSLVEERQRPARRSIDNPSKIFSRGQGPSGSKNSGHQQQSGQIKQSASVSSLDAVGLKSSKSAKHFGSKDKLVDQGLKNSKDKLSSRGGSRERLADSLPVGGGEIPTSGLLITNSKPKKKTSLQSSQMPIIQQNVIANNNLIDHRDVVDYNNLATNEKRDLGDLSAAVTFDGQKEATRQQQQQQQQLQQQQQSMMQELQSHLERLTREKMALEARIIELSSYQAEVVQLRNEIAKFQSIQERSNNEIQKLSEENETLRNRLRDVVNSPLSDAEKHQIIQDSQRLHSSAPASIALPNNHEADGTPCVTPDWDKHSSSSEVSVACLQDKIIQMEETHYSTNEELQATLQELADLQTQLSEIQSDNERLAEEKDVLFQSLCRQTEKLEDSRNQIGTLQELLLRESNQQEVGSTEREQKLLDLLKNAQEERESLLIKQEELNSELNELRQALEKSTVENGRLRERISLLDSTVDATNADRKQLESQLIQAKEESSEKQIEISRLSTLLENARAKIDELEQDRAMGDKTDLGELLDVARKEKDLLEGQVATMQEQLSKSQCEIQKLRDQLAAVNEECKVARNNAKCALSDLEYKYETLKEEKLKLNAEYQQLQDTANELQVQCKCHLEDKAQLESLLSEAQRHLGDAERLLAEKEERLQDEMKMRKQDAEEWEQFQSDLLMTVRVANDFKTEAQSAREQLVMDNKTQREKIRALEQQIDKLNKQLSTDAQTSLLNTVQQEMAARRQKVGGGISRQDSRLSVKSLIESIENVNRQTKTAGTGSRCSSSSSLNSVTSESLNGTTGLVGGNITTTQNGTNNKSNSIGDWSDNQLHTPIVTGLQAKSPLREQQQTTTGSNININGGQKQIITDIDKNNKMTTIILDNNNKISSNYNSSMTTTNYNNNNNCNNSNNANNIGRNYKTAMSDEPQNCVTSILAQKSMDFIRRNSYGDLSERKDPLNALVKNGGSKRNALLKWCQNKTVGYRNIDITNFSSSWNDGLAFCAILHSYLPDRVPYDTLGPNNKRRNFSIAFSAAESVGIPTTLNINDMCQQERPDWTQVMAYVTAIYKHFEA